MPGIVCAERSGPHRQGSPVREAVVTLHNEHDDEPLVEAVTQGDGRYALILPDTFPDDLSIHIERAHFAETSLDLSAEAVEGLRAGTSVVLPDTTLLRRIPPAFWTAACIFVAVLAVARRGPPSIQARGDPSFCGRIGAGWELARGGASRAVLSVAQTRNTR
jgi:hypothetical protein